MTACRTCAAPTNGTSDCVNCWEVERRLDLYLRSERGVEFVRTHLEKADRRQTWRDKNGVC